MIQLSAPWGVGQQTHSAMIRRYQIYPLLLAGRNIEYRPSSIISRESSLNGAAVVTKLGPEHDEKRTADNGQTSNDRGADS